MVDDDDIRMALQALGGNLKLCAQAAGTDGQCQWGRDNFQLYSFRVLREYPAAEA